MHKIVIAAIKQSGNLWLPKINDPCDFNDLIQLSDQFKNKFIAHCRSSNKKPLNNVIQQNEPQLILIGPEGDFTTNEIDKAVKNGFNEVLLSENTLRTETAALVAISIMKGI